MEVCPPIVSVHLPGFQALKEGKPYSTPPVRNAMCLLLVRQCTSHLFGSPFEKVLGARECAKRGDHPTWVGEYKWIARHSVRCLLSKWKFSSLRPKWVCVCVLCVRAVCPGGLSLLLLRAHVWCKCHAGTVHRGSLASAALETWDLLEFIAL